MNLKTSLLFFTLILLIACNNRKVEKEYYPTGELKAKYRIENEELHGTYYEYYKSGSYKEQSIYQNGKLNGIRRVYFENGQLDWEVEYKNGKENGLFKDYSKNGNLLCASYFKNGQQDSSSCWYYPNGQIEKDLQYKNGVQHGTAKFYYKNGKIKLDAIIDYGTTMYYREYSEEGELVEEYRNIRINTLSDTICVGTKFTIEINLMGPEISEFEAKFDVSSKKPSNIFDITFRKNKCTIDTVLNEPGKYMMGVFYAIQDKPYLAVDSLYIVECEKSNSQMGNTSKKLAE